MTLGISSQQTTGHRRPTPALGVKSLSEEDVHRAVVRHLELRSVNGVVWFHVPNGGGRNRVDAAVLKALGTKPGAPDLVLFHGGRAFALELKREKGGRVSPAQSEMHTKLGAAGVQVAVTAGIDEALEALKAWGLIR